MRRNDKIRMSSTQESPETIAAPDVTSEGRDGAEKQALTIG
jgi:hypothetical protein